MFLWCCVQWPLIWWGIFSFFTKGFEMFSFSILIICYCTHLLFQVITENVPITVLTSVSLISAVVIPLVGVIFGCFRCKGKCGGELIEEDLETNPKKKRRLFTAAISVCSAVIMWVKIRSLKLYPRVTFELDFKLHATAYCDRLWNA